MEAISMRIWEKFICGFMDLVTCLPVGGFEATLRGL